jgi:MtN3 and saliva related transmembrane protein
MILLDFVGYLAGLLILISLIPQIVKSWKTKSTRDLSLARYLIYTLGVVLWLVYGAMINSGPMVISNGIALLLAGSIIFLKIKYG